MTTDTFATPAELRACYDQPSEMIRKLKLGKLDRHARRFIALSPFLVLGTVGDVSPKGDAPGFVAVLDDTTLLIPDRPGNNRLDSLQNILAEPRVGLIFFVPGFNETLRVNGRGSLTREAKLLAPLAVRGKAPKAGVVVAVEEVYFHCGKALIRSRLWDPAARVARESFPTMGAIVADQVAGLDAGEIEHHYQTGLKERLY